METASEHAIRLRFIALAVVLSLLAHGLVLMWPGQPAPPSTSPASVEIALERYVTTLEHKPEPPTESQPSDPPDPSPSSSVTQAPSQNVTAQVPVETTEAVEPPTALEPEWPAFDSQRLRQQLHRYASETHPIERDNDPGRAIMSPNGPALPSAVGWLNDYVGLVTPSVDRWTSPDGSQYARIVLANGQIYCGKSDPPTTAELFNPSMSTNVMRYRHCGRERPDPIDRSNPWVRGAGQSE